MADANSPRPITVVLAAWLAMVGSGFTLVAAFLCLVALLLLRDGLADVPFLGPLAQQALGWFVAALAAATVGLWLGSLVWRRALPARWLLLGLSVPLLGLCLYVGGRPGLFFGVPLGVTALALLTPATARWFAATGVAGGRRRVAPPTRTVAVVAGCGAAALAHGAGVVVLARALVHLAGSDLGDHELADLVNPADAQTWGLALLLLFGTVHLLLAIIALAALGGSSAARIVTSVGCGIGALVHGGAALQTPTATAVGMGALFVAAVVLLATPGANAWFRDGAARTEPSADESDPAGRTRGGELAAPDVRVGAAE